MKKEDRDKVINALSEFVVRVAKGEATSIAEVAVLPEVAKVLLVFEGWVLKCFIYAFKKFCIEFSHIFTT